jgi:hypothetical protein
VRVRACVCTFTGRARVRKQGRLESTLIGFISMCEAPQYSKAKERQGRAKIRSTQVDLIFVRAPWRVTVNTRERTLTRPLARTLTRTYIRSHVRSLARLSFTRTHIVHTHTFIPPFMSLVTTRILDNQNIFTRL